MIDDEDAVIHIAGTARPAGRAPRTQLQRAVTDGGATGDGGVSCQRQRAAAEFFDCRTRESATPGQALAVRIHLELLGRLRTDTARIVGGVARGILQCAAREGDRPAAADGAGGTKAQGARIERGCPGIGVVA